MTTNSAIKASAVPHGLRAGRDRRQKEASLAGKAPATERCPIADDEVRSRGSLLRADGSDVTLDAVTNDQVVVAMRLAPRGHLGLDKIIGASPAMLAVFEAMDQVASTTARVLITGESGTGKELVARGLHQNSLRSTGPFVTLHCAALAETLLESELFGHERGAFTGAATRRDGRFTQADGGTLFLDEIGEILPSMQVKLLRFLQERTFERVGGNETLKVDVRIVAATHHDLEADVNEGRFREDLFYRLNVVNIEMPPLRARPGDVLLLAIHFLRRFIKENGKRIDGFDDDAIERMAAYRWPGNVRELENVVERAVVLCNGTKVTGRQLPAGLGVASRSPVRNYELTMAEIERRAIVSTLEICGGRTTQAAQMLDISVRKIQYKLHEYGITFDRTTVAKASESLPRSRHYAVPPIS